MTFVVGFDLDMTLLDTRPGIAATYRALTEVTGVYIDADRAVNRLGPPLPHEMAHWFPPSEIDEAVRRYRSLYPSYAIAPSPPLPGAADALAAVRAAGGRVAVITAKIERLARLHLDHVGFAVDEVVGDAFAARKTAALLRLAASVFVGDHTADVRAAVTAGSPVVPVGVTTGPCDRDELSAAGARVVLSSLGEFPAWFRRYRADADRSDGAAA